MSDVSFDIKLKDLFSRPFKQLTNEANRNADKLQRKLEKMSTSDQRVSKMPSVGGGFGLGKLAGIGAGLFATDKIIELGREVVMTTAKFETFEAVLTNTLGSRSAAQQALSDIQKFAARTPFSVQKLTDSFIKLSNRGFAPGMSDMQAMGDIASSVGKDIDQLVEAVLDAQMGEFERLKEFGIKGSKEGERLTFMFKGQKIAVDATTQGMKSFIAQLGNVQGVMGSMSAISATTTGKISNLGDAWDRLLVAMGSKTTGIVNDAIDSISKLITTTTNWLETPVVDKLAQQRTEINALINGIINLNESEQQRAVLIAEANQKYPELFKNLDWETAKSEDLLTILTKVNDQYDKRIKLSASEQVQQNLQQQVSELDAQIADATIKLDLLKQFETATSDVQRQAIMETFNKDLTNRGLLAAAGPLGLVGMMTQDRLAGTSDIKDLREKFALEKVKNQTLVEDLRKELGLQTEIVNKDKAKVDVLGAPSDKGIGTGNGLISGINNVTGSSGVKNITINVGKFQDQTVIETTEAVDSIPKLESEFTNMFLRVLNQANATYQ